MHSSKSGVTEQRGSILLVEDDGVASATIASLLENEGYSVQAAENGKEALGLLKGESPPDLIILDLMMPEIDGWQFRTIQRADLRICGIPVLAMSADGTSKSEAIDATAFLHKPFRLEALLEKIDDILMARETARLRSHQAALLAALGTVAASALHEMSNPLSSTMISLAAARRELAGMRLDATLALDAPLERLEELLTETGTGAQRIHGVMRGLQSVARKSDDVRQLIALQEVLDCAVVLTKHRLRQCARLIQDVPNGLPPIRGSELRLGQVFTNLLVNAAQAIGEGNAQSNEIRISARDGQRGVVVEIADTGAGMTPEVRKRLFEPFFTTKPPGEGTGLGLPICQEIVNEHGGSMEIDSEPGKGSRVRVVLPVERDVLPASGRSGRIRPIPSQRGSVLIVHDDAEVLRALTVWLEADHEVTATTHGQEVLDRLAWGQHVDVVLCALTMPFMSGERLHREVARRFGEDSALKMIFLVGGTPSPGAMEFLRSVPNRTLRTPIDPREVTASVAEAVGQRSEIRSPRTVLPGTWQARYPGR